MRGSCRRSGTSVLLLAVLLAAGCDWPFVNPYDPDRCVPICAGGQTCYQGQCIADDAGKHDSATRDGRTEDNGTRDGRLLDTQRKDFSVGSEDRPKDVSLPDQPSDAGVVAPDTGKCKVDNDCDDKIPCTIDSCSAGVCASKIAPGYCLIAKACVLHGAVSPGNVCQKCSTVKSATAWTDDNGKSCDDGKACTHSDLCKAGACVGTVYQCDDKLSCTTDTCTAAAPPGECQFTVKAGHCLINGTCHGAGKAHPSDACKKCEPMLYTATWVAAKGCVITMAGSGIAGFADGTASSARFRNPFGVAVDSNGDVYVADWYHNRIRVIVGGAVKTLAGNGTAGHVDGLAASAQFNAPTGVAVDALGKVYVADSNNHRVRVVYAGQVVTLAGSGVKGNADGVVATAQFATPYAVAATNVGGVYVADRGNHRIRFISGGKVSTFAGDGVAGFADGFTSSARFNNPSGLAIGPSGEVLVADSGNNRIRQVFKGTVATVAGTGTAGFADGVVAKAMFSSPSGIAVDSSGSVYVADSKNHRVRVIQGGTVSTLAGSASGFADGKCSLSLFNTPVAVSSRGLGLVYISDWGNHRIRLMSP